MIKQMLKMANVPTEKALRKKYPTEADFLREHGAEMFYMYGGSYADGGMAPEQQGMEQGPPPGAEQGQPQQGGGDEQMQQVIQAVMQMLQQGMPPEEIVKKLVESGIPEDQAGQLVQAIVQKMQGGGGQGGQQQGPQEEMMEGPQGQEAPPQEMVEGQAPMGMYGGAYARGGQTFNPGGNSTYYQGMSYANGGPFVPQYANQAYGVEYATGGSTQGSAVIEKVAQMLSQGMQPEAVLAQLVQAKIPKKKAVTIVQQAIAMVQQGAGMAQQEQAPQMSYGGPYMPLSSPRNTTDYARGGVVKYQKGGEYEMSHSDIQDLINKGYKIQYL